EQWDPHDLLAHHAPHIANGMITPKQLDQMETPEAEEADTQILQLKHFHHQGAIATTAAHSANGDYQPLADLAQQMIDIQTAEMHEREQLLEAKGESLLTE